MFLNRPLFTRNGPRICFLAVSLAIVSMAASRSALGDAFAGQQRPNFLWITAEDMSPTLGCYGDPDAVTPHIDRLAEQSVRYTHAFATTPVCSPARSCLITGCYAPSLGTHQMRSAFPIPAEMKGFPARLRQAGYYTTNNVKTDYNTANWQEIIRASWDESSATAHWRNRPNKDQPFFAVFNLMTSHQSRSMVWPREQFVAEVQSKLSGEEIHDPQQVRLPPYYPDTPVIRQTVARFHDCVTLMDKQVGAILDELAADGLADETIVFFYSDHGSGMPRHKRALLDSGMHVPLLIRFPQKYRRLAPVNPGETTDRLVSFVDFGPTMLNLAGVHIPDAMQGQPFLGPGQDEAREFVFGHRDRVDEAIDCARSVRTQRYLYIRNFMPQLGYNQPTAWPDQGAIRHEFYRLTDRDRMTDAQWHFAGPTRPIEELYDCQRDPANLHNLADSAEQSETLTRMRDALRRHVLVTRDVGFVPESEAWRIFEDSTAWQTARSSDLKLGLILDAAEHVGTDNESALLERLASDHASIRYWAAVGLSASPEISAKAAQQLIDRLSDDSHAVRIESATALARHGRAAIAAAALIECLQSKSLTTVLYAARALEMLYWPLGSASVGDDPNAASVLPQVTTAMRQVLERAGRIRPADTPATVVQSGDQDLAMFISFAAGGFLARHADSADRDFEPLFDGKSLDGWTAMTEGDVAAKYGEIQLLAKGKNLWLLNDQTFGDFELTVEAKMPKDGYNSGIGFRCTAAGNKPKGYQCEIDRQKSGMIYAIGSGWVWPKGAEQTKEFYRMAGDAFRDEQWNTFRIRCVGDHIQIWVNDVKTADLRDDRFARGSVALQHHGKGGIHRFRNIRIRPID